MRVGNRKLGRTNYRGFVAFSAGAILYVAALGGVYVRVGLLHEKAGMAVRELEREHADLRLKKSMETKRWQIMKSPGGIARELERIHSTMALAGHGQIVRLYDADTFDAGLMEMARGSLHGNGFEGAIRHE